LALLQCSVNTTKHLFYDIAFASCRILQAAGIPIPPVMGRWLRCSQNIVDVICAEECACHWRGADGPWPVIRNDHQRATDKSYRIDALLRHQELIFLVPLQDHKAGTADLQTLGPVECLLKARFAVRRRLSGCRFECIDEWTQIVSFAWAGEGD